MVFVVERTEFLLTIDDSNRLLLVCRVGNDVLIVFDYLVDVFPLMDPWYWSLFLISLSISFAISCNVIGLKAVDWVFGLEILILTLFVLFISFSAREMTTNKIFTPSPAGVGDPDFLLLLSTVMWKFCRFDTVAAVSVEARTRSTSSYR